MKKVSIVGLDIAKSSFHAHGADGHGVKVFSKALPRGRVLEFPWRIDQPDVMAKRPSMRFVAVKTAESQGEAMVLKTRELLTTQMG